MAVAAPAGPVDPERLEEGAARLRRAGFEVVWRDDVLDRRGYLAGDDARRAEELMAWVRDPEVDAILCARGGYGCHRMVERLDAAAVRAAAKPLVGFSDVTTLLLWQLRQAGLVGFHGPMPARTHRDEDVARLFALLAGEGAKPLEGRPGGGGVAEGRLVGGNLAVLVASLGCAWEPDTEGAILLFEDVGERPYRLDRMLAQLRSAGKLAGLAGVGVGSLDGCCDEHYPEPAACDVVEEALRPLGIPLVLDLPFGHGESNVAWPVGVRARLDGGTGRIEWLESGVEERR